MSWPVNWLVPLSLFVGLPVAVLPLLTLGVLTWADRRVSARAGRLSRAVVALLIVLWWIQMTAVSWEGSESTLGIGGALLGLPVLLSVLAAVAVAGRVAVGRLAGRRAVAIVLVAGVLAAALVLWLPWYGL